MQRNTEYIEGWELIIGVVIAHPLKRYLQAKELSALTLTSTSCNAAYRSSLDKLKLLYAAQHKDLKTVEDIYKSLETKYSDAWLLLLPVIEYALYSGDFTGGAEDDDNERIRINSYLYNRVLKLIPEEHLPTVCTEVNKFVNEGTQYGSLLSAYERLLTVLNEYKSEVNWFMDNNQRLSLDHAEQFNQTLANSQSQIGHFGILWYANHMSGTSSTMDTPILTRDIFVTDCWQQVSKLDTKHLGKKYFLFHYQNQEHSSVYNIHNTQMRDPDQIQSQIEGVEFFISNQKLIVDVLVEELQSQTNKITPH